MEPPLDERELASEKAPGRLIEIEFTKKSTDLTGMDALDLLIGGFLGRLRIEELQDLRIKALGIIG
jgi:hypothetical protein